MCFTSRPAPGTLGRKLVDVLWRKLPKTVLENLNVVHRQRIPLRGADLEAFLAEKRQKEKEEAERAEALALEESALEEDAETMFGPDDDDDDDLAATALARHDIMAPQITKAGQEFFTKAKTFDMSVIACPLNRRVRSMVACLPRAQVANYRYPCVDRRPRWDDYGEIIRPEDYRVEDPREVEQRAMEAAAAEAAAAAAAASQRPEEVPTKCISREIRVQV